jgi:hypothetical protein
VKAYSVAKTELSSLNDLYGSSLYAFAQTEEVLRYKARCRYNRHGAVDEDLVIVQPIKYKLKPAYTRRVRQQLLELIFIRLVSVLEAYLVDTVRDIFVMTKDPFKDQLVQVNFTQAEILSIDSMSYVLSKIINKECRRLTSGGFSEIIKYYRTRFDIDLPGIPPGKSVMEEYHERRHLLVHRLGKPDTQYRRRHIFTGKEVTVDEAYLNSCFQDFEGVIESVNQKLAVWLPTIASGEYRALHQASVTYRVVILGDAEPACLEEDFQFWVGDELHFLHDILKGKKYLSQCECDLTLAGEQEALRAYGKGLRNAAKGLYLTATVTRTEGLHGPPKTPLDEALICKVQENLPAQPWQHGIHKVIAQRCGISNKKVSKAIQVLIQRGVFKPQIKGAIGGSEAGIIEANRNQPLARDRE